MRLAPVLLFVVLATSTASADTPPLPFEIVSMLPETNQVLIYDRAHKTHVLLQPGSTFEDYTVLEIHGVDMIVEKQQQRFTVYPREAKYLSLNLYPPPPSQPPIIFTKSAAAPAPARVADAVRTVPFFRPTLMSAPLSSKLAP